MAEKDLQNEIRSGSFDWNIDGFLESDMAESSEFKFGMFYSSLKICETLLTIDYVGDLYTINFDNYTDFFSNETHYKLSILDRNGDEAISTRGTVSENDSDSAGLLFCKRYLEKYSSNILPQGTLTVRLMWFEADKSDKSENRPIKSLMILSADFERFYESKVDTDCVLRVGNAQNPVHRAVLSARSDVFAAMFHHDTSEKRCGVVDILDIDATVLNDVLFYVYSGRIRGLSATTAVSMYAAADKYALINLGDACMDFLKCNLTVENVCDAALLAHTHGEAELEEKIIHFVKDNLEEIEETNQWKELLKSKPSLPLKLLRSALMIYKDKLKKLSSKQLIYNTTS